MKAKMSGQFQGSGGKQSIEIDGSIELPEFAALLARVAKLEEELKALAAPVVVVAAPVVVENVVDAAPAPVKVEEPEVPVAAVEEVKVVASKPEEEPEDADDDDKNDDKVANKAQKNSKPKKPAGKP